MPTDVTVSVNDLAVISQTLNLAALFPTAARTMRQIDCIQNRTMMGFTPCISAESKENKSSVRGVSVYNPQLLAQQIGHVHTVCPIMAGFVIPADNGKHLPGNRGDQIHHRRQFFHRREIRIGIPQTAFQGTVEQISRKNTVGILMGVYIIYILAYSIMIRMRVSVVIVGKDKQLYGLVVSR